MCDLEPFSKIWSHFIANAIAEQKQVTVFLTAIGGPMYELLKNLVLLDAPRDKYCTWNS